MNEYQPHDRDAALVAAFDLYMSGDWPIGHVAALRRVTLADWSGVKVKWQKGPGTRFVAFVYTPRGDIPLAPERRKRMTI
jgi:hypothetical protein